MDKETKKILSDNEQLAELVNHGGWHVARRKLSDKILDLQNAFNIEDKTADEMIVDLKSRKMASLVLFDFLREIEGSAQDNTDDKPKKKSYIVELP